MKRNKLGVYNKKSSCLCIILKDPNPHFQEEEKGNGRSPRMIQHFSILSFSPFSARAASPSIQLTYEYASSSRSSFVARSRGHGREEGKGEGRWGKLRKMGMRLLRFAFSPASCTRTYTNEYVLLLSVRYTRVPLKPATFS